MQGVVLVEYWLEGVRKGMLAWQDGQAVGGFDPADKGCLRGKTVVRAGSSVRVLADWPHPDQIAETNSEGADGLGVVMLDADANL